MTTKSFSQRRDQPHAQHHASDRDRKELSHLQSGRLACGVCGAECRIRQAEYLIFPNNTSSRSFTQLVRE